MNYKNMEIVLGSTEEIQGLSRESITRLQVPAELSSSLSKEDLSEINASLVPGSPFVLLLPDGMPGDQKSAIRKSLLLGGFTSVKVHASEIRCLKPASTSAVSIRLINLANEEEYKQLAGNQDCLTKPKPCKNCTCGRKDEVQTEVVKTEAVSSDCGRCYMGDAFRCAGCPYSGLPSFMPGEKPPIDLLVKTEASAKVEGGVVRLSP